MSGLKYELNCDSKKQSEAIERAHLGRQDHPLAIEFGSGDSFPTLEAGTLRIYSMQFCPYAQRTRLVLHAKNIPHEVIDINTEVKPEWIFEKNPNGLVPILEKGGDIVYESSICDEYLDETYPDALPRLLPKDPLEKAKMKMLMEAVSKISPRAYRMALQDKEQIAAGNLVTETMAALQVFEEAANGKQYLGGDELTMIDIHAWPFIERLAVLKEMHGLDFLSSQKFPSLSRYYKHMLTEPCVKATINSAQEHIKFYAEHVKGLFPTYL